MTVSDALLLPPPPRGFPVSVVTLIIGAGACGITAALAARERGQEVLVLERDALPRGSTALSAGLIPAAGSRWQRLAGIDDSPAIFAADIQAKADQQADPAIVERISREAAATLEWLAVRYAIPFSLVDDFDYPGHQRRRMHGTPRRTGVELLDHLRAASEEAGVDILCQRRVTALYRDAERIVGVQVTSPDGDREAIGCQRLILACNGFAANRERVASLLPSIASALYFGHPGNQGEALAWGEALGAATQHLGAYQGHGAVAHPHGILITWATITAGGFQVNQHGERFWNEAQGYSEAARVVLAQPQGIAYQIFDERIAAIARQFEDFRQAEAAGAVLGADTIEELATRLNLPSTALAATVAQVDAAKAGEGDDPFQRPWQGQPVLQPPWRGVRVSGALFHTQGGLAIDRDARVLRAADRQPFPNLYAAGGAACGVSGAGDSGYLSGNGLLTAVVLGRIAGLGVNASA